MELPYDPAIPFLGIHTEETRSERDTCTPMFITALFIIARTWKQPRCPSADEWIRNLWYIYTVFIKWSRLISRCLSWGHWSHPPGLASSSASYHQCDPRQVTQPLMSLSFPISKMGIMTASSF